MARKTGASDITVDVVRTDSHPEIDDLEFALRLQRFVAAVVVPEIIKNAPSPSMNKVYPGPAVVTEPGMIEVTVIVPKHYRFVESGVTEEKTLRPLVELNEEGRPNVLALATGDYRTWTTLKLRAPRPFVGPTISALVGDWMKNGLA